MNAEAQVPQDEVVAEAEAVETAAVVVDDEDGAQAVAEVVDAETTEVVEEPVDDAADEDGDDADDDGDEEDELIEEGEIAGDYLEQLLDVLDFDGDIDLDVDGDRAIVSIDGGKDLSKLVGRRGEVLDALQELTRLAVQQATGERSRLMLDIARWRAGRRERLVGLGTEVAQRVLASGEREALEPMTPFERKIVHDAVAAVDGVVSKSEGAEPKRRVVVIKVP
ncbi:MAG TPA: R3H domain-containing nucleic acid-binding protein [Gordonia sp. (in: high G+C Gram-positive bacteria)]|uniref:Jag family protein n=1 Tax=unclassified Gordonia (in: high G+C Gram-positive bacteria) TaxID=2657482 RepID=UPI0025C42CB9|nr:MULTISPECIES: R3H domain-containing nucleic acid-binding protein [unclassified Gordonia (in: high G+C Gram-positive bacteria)]HNP56439.1 R3H domain-containing nucleic acid-binding protein [Gordonia sp. (in: high G+C Gram-positive bacteria)]HRC50808.1 R3H domain-containing nucleic acid-binding protein [Gordonia sp. (in: high G+C Gram-positive bacteria)]